jgi:GNAT superfamily N-acetyltransferase
MSRRDFDSWSIRGLWRRTREVLRDEGLRSLWFKILGEICYRRLLLVERVLDGSTRKPGGLGCLSMLTTSDLDRYRRLQPDADPDEIGIRLERGDFCFAMNHEGEIIHVCWVRRGRAHIDYLDCEVELPSDVGYAYEVFTKPEVRGRGVAGRRARLMEPPLIDAGFRAVLSAIGPEDGASLHFNQQAGHKVVGRMGYWRLGPWRRDFFRIRSASFAMLTVEKGTRKPG